MIGARADQVSRERVRQITHEIELGFLDFVSGLAQEHGGWELAREPEPDQVIGASCVLRNRVGVEFILEVEATWEPDR